VSAAQPVRDAEALGVPFAFNVASYFIDRHLAEGRGAKVALECGDEQVTYGDLSARVNRLGRAMRERLSVRSEERVVLLLFDGPSFFYSFFGVMKAGAVAVPINALDVRGLRVRPLRLPGPPTADAGATAAGDPPNGTCTCAGRCGPTRSMSASGRGCRRPS
jgi:hypothetical protein